MIGKFDGFERTEKELAMAYSKYCPRICLDEPDKSTKNSELLMFVPRSKSACREYNSKVLLLD
jgi:hypothetical protein